MRIMVADWMAALKPFKPETVIEARRLWLTDPETGTRAPKIADLIALVQRLETAPQFGKIGPPPEYLVPRHDGKFSDATPAQRWSWYSRMHAFCEATKREPTFDRRRMFRDDNLTTQAIGEAQTSGKAKLWQSMTETTDGYVPPAPADPTVVRWNWRKIRVADLTDAERELCEASITEIAASSRDAAVKHVAAQMAANFARQPNIVVDSALPAAAAPARELIEDVLDDQPGEGYDC